MVSKGNVGDNTDLIPKATELLWNKCEKSYWNALNTISLYDEDEGFQALYWILILMLIY